MELTCNTVARLIYNVATRLVFMSPPTSKGALRNAYISNDKNRVRNYTNEPNSKKKKVQFHYS
jgi:hypothetical protein